MDGDHEPILRPGCEALTVRLANDERRGAVELLHALRSADHVMHVCGWQLLDASVNLETGFVRLIAEARDQRARKGIKLTLLRSSWNNRTVIERSRTTYHEGFYSSAWEVLHGLGLDRVDTLSEAVEFMLHYLCDNSTGGEVPKGMADRRREMFARHFARIAPMRNVDAVASLSIGGGDLTEEWISECERVCCRGDGFDPYIPSVTASDCHGRRWVATSGLIVDGRGVHREGTFARGPAL